MEFNSFRKFISKLITESRILELDSDMMDEERIANTDSKYYVTKRENFIGSHIYGENLGELGKMYVCYSYGVQFPAYLWYKGKWYHNTDDYILDDGSVNEYTKAHMDEMRPTNDTHGLSTHHLNSMINSFKKKYSLPLEPTHSSVEPGEKN